MKLFTNSSRAYYLYHKIQTHFFSTTTPTRTRFSQNKSPSTNLLYSKISSSGDPNISMVPLLDQWVAEHKFTSKKDLTNIIHTLMVHKRFKHALEVSLWMTNKRGCHIAPFDVAVRLKLINKIYGLEQVEDYFDKIPENLKTYHVYLALLNCYTIAKSVDKAESIMQKARDLGYVRKAIWYNLLMNLHYRLGNRDKINDLLIEMDVNNVSSDPFSLSVCLSACAMSSDAVGMDKIVSMLESDPQDLVHYWRTFVVAAEGYLKMGLIDKALRIMKNLEGKLIATEKSHQILFVFLFNLYAEAGKKDELYRIWELYKTKDKAANKIYISMMRALMKFGDIEGMERILEEWELSGLFIDFRVLNFLIDAYCSDGCLEKAEALVAEGVSKGGHPMALTWCRLAGGYLQENRVPEAIEALKKAISVCPPKFMTKDSLMTCLEYLESGDCLEKAEELLKLVRMNGISRKASSDDTCGLIEDVGFENQNSGGIFGSGDEHIMI